MSSPSSPKPRPGRATPNPVYRPGSVPRGGGGGGSSNRPGKPLPPGQAPQTPTVTTSGQPVRVDSSGYITAGGRFAGSGGQVFNQSGGGNYQLATGEVQQVDYQFSNQSRQTASPSFIAGTKIPQAGISTALADRGAFGAVSSVNTPQGTAYSYPVFGTGGYRPAKKTRTQEALADFDATFMSADTLARTATPMTVSGTGRRAVAFAGRTGLGDAIPFLRSERFQNYAGSRIDSQVAVGLFVPRGVSTVGGAVDKVATRSSGLFSVVESVGRSSNAPLPFSYAAREVGKVGRRGSDLFGGAGAFAYERPVTTTAGVIGSEAIGYGAGAVVTRAVVNPFARRAAAKYAPGSIEGLNAAFRSSRRTEAVIGGVGLGGFAFAERNATAREVGADLLFVAPGAVGAGRGVRAGTRVRTTVSQVGESRITVPFSSGSGLRSQVRSYRTEDFNLGYEAFPGFRSKVMPVRASESLRRTTFMRVGGRALGETIPVRFSSFTSSPRAGVARTIGGVDSFRGRYNIRTEGFDFYRYGRGGRQSEFYRSSFSGRNEDLSVSGFTTTDVFAVRGGGRKYIGSDISRSNIKYEDFGNYFRGFGSETRPLRFQSPGMQSVKTPRASGFSIGRRGQVAIGRSPFSDTSFTDFTGTGIESPPIEVTRLSPFSRSGFRGSRVGFPSSSLPMIGVRSSILSSPLGLSVPGLLGAARSGAFASSISPFTSQSVASAFPQISSSAKIIATTTPVSTAGSSTLVGSFTEYTPFSPSSSSTPSITGPSPPVDVPPFVGFPGFGIPLFGKGSTGGREGRGRSRGFRYAPSFNAVLFGIKGKRPTGPLSGFETRPILKR